MTRENEWRVFEKAVEITASAVRGAMGGEGSQPPSFVAEVFRETHAALTAIAEEIDAAERKTGF
jgi:hypothetical protein